MMARCELLLLACLLSLAVSLMGGIPHALAEGSPTSATFVPSDTPEGRSGKLHKVMACGNEFEFAQRFFLARKYGKNGLVPVQPKNESKEAKKEAEDEAARLSGLADWPVTLMLGKAARLTEKSHDPAKPCNVELNGAVSEDWGKLTANPGGSPADVVNRVYEELFDSIPGVSGKACAQVAHLSVADEADTPAKVTLSLSDACLARQIRAVMTDPRHGPWKEEKGEVMPEFPGTDPSKLPCVPELTFGVKGVKGDWDMKVIEYTRLASLLYRWSRRDEGIEGGADVDAALAALNRRFLTLRSSPNQGATAREVFDLLTSCGNLPNQFGDAIDTVNGSGADPGADRYSEAAKDAVGKKSFWEDFLRFIVSLLVVIAIAVVTAIFGFFFGILTGAIATTSAVTIAVVAAVTILSTIIITVAGGGIEETENHLLMQNTSRYLKNKLMMAELSEQRNRKAFDTIAGMNEEVRTWLLKRLQRIAREDFVEYNAKPYNRLSHASILNLLDYACDVSWDYDSSRIILNSDRPCDVKDRAIVDAAAAVLDLSAAKLAVGSFEGRRLIPYRRLAEENYKYYTGRSFLELIGGADNQLAALQIWTGQMRHAPDCVAWPGTFGDLVWYSTSQYRPDPMILDMAVNKTVAREQQYRHHTRERYVSGNGWLITAGGTDEGPAQGFRTGFGFTIYPKINENVKNDQGVGVPTTLMTGAPGRASMQQFLRFEGNKQDWGLEGKPLWSFSDNNCVAGSFACGLALRFPSDFDLATCQTQFINRNFFVVDSTKCAAFNDLDESTANDIFIAIFQSPQGWGFFEVAQQDAYGRSAIAFADAIKANNKDRFSSWLTADSSDTVEYFAVTQNRLLKFTPKNEIFSANRRACGVVNHESGARFTISNVPAEKAGACLSVGPRIFINLDDAMNPIRKGDGGLQLERFY